MNSQSLRAKVKNISKIKNVDINALIRFYMYERFLERLSVSKYKNNFILKGGYYLSTIFGLENRTTMDIDACVKNVDFSKEEIENIINDIIKINLKDGIKIEVDSIQKIR